MIPALPPAREWWSSAGAPNVEADVRVFDGFDAAEWRLTLIGTTSDHVRCHPLDVTLPASDPVLHGALGGRSKRDDLLPFEQRVVHETPLGGSALSSNVHLPFFGIDTGDRSGVFVAIGWSGAWSARCVPVPGGVRVTAGVDGFDPVLQQDERVTMPRILVMRWTGDRVDGHNAWRRLLRHHYLRYKAAPLVSVNVCFTGHDPHALLDRVAEPVAMARVEPSMHVGAELLVIDAGWYPGEDWFQSVGDWRVDPAKYPRGFQPLANKAAQHGIRLGVWFWPEAANPGAPVVLEHPDWLGPTVFGVHSSLRVDLPQVRDWFATQVDAVVAQGASCYRTDGHGDWPPDAPERSGIAQIRYVQGLYDLWDEIIRRHPELILEGCCSGGRRIDLETLSRFRSFQKSDRWFDAESDQVAAYGANLYLPGGWVNIPTNRTDDYGAWSSFGGQLCCGWVFDDVGFSFEQARLQTDRYKRIRELLSGDFYPHTPATLDGDWLAWQLHRDDLGRGCVLAFRRAGNAHLTVRLRGLDPDAAYAIGSVRGDASIATAEELGCGLMIKVAQAPGAELLMYEQQTS